MTEHEWLYGLFIVLAIGFFWMQSLSEREKHNVVYWAACVFCQLKFCQIGNEAIVVAHTTMHTFTIHTYILIIDLYIAREWFHKKFNFNSISWRYEVREKRLRIYDVSFMECVLHIHLYYSLEYIYLYMNTSNSTRKRKRKKNLLLIFSPFCNFFFFFCFYGSTLLLFIYSVLYVNL